MNRKRAERFILKEALPHLSIILSGMLIVLLAIDKVNSYMVFIDHRITKGLMLILCAASIINGAQLLARPAQRPTNRRGDKTKCSTNPRKKSETSASSRT